MTEVKIYWKLLDSVGNHWQLLVKINVNHWKDLAELEMFWKLSDTVRNHWQFLVDNNVQIWTYFDILTSDLNFAINEISGRIIFKSRFWTFTNLNSEQLKSQIPTQLHVALGLGVQHGDAAAIVPLIRFSTRCIVYICIINPGSEPYLRPGSRLCRCLNYIWDQDLNYVYMYIRPGSELCLYYMSRF